MVSLLIKGVISFIGVIVSLLIDITNGVIVSLLNKVVDELTLLVVVIVGFGAGLLSLVQASKPVATNNANRATLDKFFMALFLMF